MVNIKKRKRKNPIVSFFLRLEKVMEFGNGVREKQRKSGIPIFWQLDYEDFLKILFYIFHFSMEPPHINSITQKKITEALKWRVSFWIKSNEPEE